nr:endonuclease/exonuclease/phosphatase family protein [Streptomyces purpureus]
MTRPQNTPHHTAHHTAHAAAVLLLLPPAVVVACRLTGTDAVTPVPQLLAFLPWLTLPAALATALALAARHRPTAAAAATVLALTAWYIQPYGPDTSGAHGPTTARLRVLASNVEFGRATPHLLDTVRREHPHLVLVSECDRPCAHTLRTALRTTHPHHTEVAADGSSGSLLLSTYPLTHPTVLPGVMGMPGATALIGERDVHIQLAHPMPPLPGQIDLWKTELGHLRDLAHDRRGRPTLIAGDFNASQDHAAFRDLLDAGDLHDAARLAGATRTPTWPQTGALPPYVQIDHILLSDHFSVDTVRFLDLPDTDHRAVLADLALHQRQ